VAYLFFVSGIRTDYGVEYPLANICVLENSSVFIPCTFFYPAGSSVTRVMWGHERNDLYEGPFLYDSDNLNLTSRFRYNGDKKNNCSFTIQNIGRNDSGKYAFRFETTEDTGKFTGITGSVLQVFGKFLRLQPSVGGTIKEGDSVHLECENPCNRTHQSITWFKNGAPVREGSKLDLGPVSPSDSGNYTCSLSDHLGTTTAAVHVDVEYGPKNTRASPPMEIDSGTRVSLVCQSLANPPVKSYVWFRIIDGVQEVGNQSVWVTSENGEYFCRATNKHGSQNSSIVTVEIKGEFVERGSLNAELRVHEDCSFSLQSHADTPEHQEPGVQGCGDHGNSSCAPPYASNVIPKYQLRFNSD
uniref:Ig-like domain-containing protein n=1 Tax=Takifugu rubripes TaxID=31033 RepID=H2TTV7_TAKRU